MNKKRSDKKEALFEILAFLGAITWLPMIIYSIVKKIVTGEDPPNRPPSTW